MSKRRTHNAVRCTLYADNRPWGRWVLLDRGKFYKVKRIEVLPGARLSLQRHRYRSEHWTVVSGKAEVTRGSKVLKLKENQSLFIPLRTPHRVSNPGRRTLVFIEVQCGRYLGEDDIVRLADDYGRLKDKQGAGYKKVGSNTD